jgi:hypothetical protein
MGKQEGGLPADAELLRTWSEQLCRVPFHGPEEVAAGLGIKGSVEFGADFFTIEPPPAGTRKIMIMMSENGLDHIEVWITGSTMTRAQIDSHFGQGSEVPRLYADSVYGLAYIVEVQGAPFRCEVYAAFNEAPAATSVPDYIMLVPALVVAEEGQD